MPEYLAPGVYVEEVDTGAKPIEGVSTSTAGMVGVTERGPVNVPIFISSTGEFRRWFGGHLRQDLFEGHNMLPHGVEGFFTNGGKRLFVTRVAPNNAVAANATLYGRGGPGTRLLRAAEEGTGSAVTPLIILDGGGLNSGDTIRIGNGSQSEYHEIAADPAPANHVPVTLPLARAHNIGETVERYTQTDDTSYTDNTFTSMADIPVGATEMVLVPSGGDADRDALFAAVTAGPQLLRFGNEVTGEFRIAVYAVVDGSNVWVTLDRPLDQPHDISEMISALEIAVLGTSALSTAVNPGEQLLWLDNAALGAITANDLIDINSAGGSREIVRVGELGSVQLTAGAYEPYPTGSQIEMLTDPLNPVMLAVNPIHEISFEDVSSFSVGEELVIVDGATSPAFIETIDSDNNVLTFLEDIAGATGVHSPVKTLSAGASEGDTEIQINNRISLQAGDILQIGTGTGREFVEIMDIPGAGGPGPNAGVILLTLPLKFSHADGDDVQKTHAPAVRGAADVSRLVSSTTEDDSEIVFVSGRNDFSVDAFSSGDALRITTPGGASFLHVAEADSTVIVPQEVPIRHDGLVLPEEKPLLRSHARGSAVAERTGMLAVQALDSGGWGNRLLISVEDHKNGLVPMATVDDNDGDRVIQLLSSSGVEAGTVLQLLDSDDEALEPPVKVSAVGPGPDYKLTLQHPLTPAQRSAIETGGPVRARSLEFRLTVHYLRPPDPALPSRNDTIIDAEIFEYLSMDPRHSRYVVTIVGEINGVLRLSDRRPEGQSWYIRVEDLAPEGERVNTIRIGPERLEDMLPRGRTRPARHALSSGDDRVTQINSRTYIGDDHREPEYRTGLFTLKNEENISIVAIPGQTGVDVQGALITHCELMRYRFAVLDGPVPPADTLLDVQSQRQQFDSKYAALYHPWLLIPDPFPRNLQDISDYPIPPSGSMAGIYARTDIERGVHKAPANTVVRGIRGLQRQLNKAEHDMLNPSPVNINVIRDFRRNNRGIRVWGGRCITSDTDWKYVNVRRLLIFIEASIDRGLQWVVFEPNAEPLWARVSRTVSNFLTTVWRNGALEGTTVEEAFFVKCDRTTMTQTDIDNGKLICEIGVAPVKPAEYVIIRIGLWTAHAED